MSKFAEYAPGRRPTSRLGPADGLVVRPTSAADLPQVALIVAEREEGEPAVWFERLARELAQIVEPPTRALWVAALGERVIGHARAGWFVPPPGSPPDVAPEGWYLMGVVVDPAFRGHGVGEELTRARLAWIAQRSRRALYFATAINRVTIDLHAKLGFVEVTRSFSFPSASFTGGAGVLFECALAADSTHALRRRGT